jgi:hypothetical protein
MGRHAPTQTQGTSDRFPGMTIGLVFPATYPSVSLLNDAKRVLIYFRCTPTVQYHLYLILLILLVTCRALLCFLSAVARSSLTRNLRVSHWCAQKHACSSSLLLGAVSRSDSDCCEVVLLNCLLEYLPVGCRRKSHWWEVAHMPMA